MSRLELFEDLSVQDAVVTALDILLVYYLIYRVLLTIKGTRAAQMLIGIVVIGAAFFVSENLEMRAVSWLLDNFIQYFIIIIIVVFQQDIRRGLMRLGQTVPLGRSQAMTHAMDEVIAAAEKLAKARIGAIIVFERDATLHDFAEHGKAIEAKVSKELLTALFVPSRDNALHDGAVIIDKRLRIQRAGVVLPLSRSGKLGQSYGTRHRAALGITEETDAIALVVSEERGEISVCYRGGIARDLEAAALRSALQALFDTHGSSRAAEEAHAASEISKAVAALARDMSESAAQETAGSSGGLKRDDTTRIIRNPQIEENDGVAR